VQRLSMTDNLKATHAAYKRLIQHYFSKAIALINLLGKYV